MTGFPSFDFSPLAATVFDILYSEINLLRAARGNEKKQIEISKIVVKKVFYGFYVDSITCYESDIRCSKDGSSVSDEILRRFCQRFMDVIVEVKSIMPEQVIEDLFSFVHEMKSLLSGSRRCTLEFQIAYRSRFNKCATDALDMYNKFDKYFV